MMRNQQYADEIKARVSCRQMLEANGVKVNRHGFAVCPLHGDTDASLKVYGGGRGWVCYGCHKGGDVINLARELYGIGFKDALQRINQDFGLGLDIDGEVDQLKALKWAQKRIRQEAEERKRLQERERLEREYEGWLDWFLFLDGMVAENEPARDEHAGPAFGGFLGLRRYAMERLQDLEDRRIRADGRVA